jgi:hypothetical protein
MPAVAVARKDPPAPILPEELRDKIAAAKARFAQLTDQQAELAEASLTDTGAEKRYHATVAELSTTDAEIRRLETALASIERKASEALSFQQAQEQERLREREARLLGERIPVAKEFSEHLALAVEAFRKLSELSDRAFMAFPGQQPQGAALGNAELVGLIAAEMFRLGAVAPVTGRAQVGRGVPSLPAPKAPGLEFLARPEAIKPLVAAIEEANTFAKAVMEGKR